MDVAAGSDFDSFLSELEILEKKAVNSRAMVNEQLRIQQSVISEIDGAKITLKRMRLSPEQRESVQSKIESIASYVPGHPHFILQFTLGQAQFNLSDKERFKYKQAYEYFKLRMTVASLVLSAMSLVLGYHWMDNVLCFQQLYFYVCVTLRERILEIHGSRIRRWWGIHHYLSLIMTGILLIWPHDVCYIAMRKKLIAFSMYNSCLQYLQFRYQMTRLYTLRALSKADTMETTSELTDVRVIDGLRMLVPFILIAHTIQLLIGAALFRSWRVGKTHGWQSLVLAIIFVVLAAGNAATTLSVYYAKERSARNRRTE